jgi:hypothetical protein
MSQLINRRNLVKYGLAILSALSLGHWRIPASFSDGPSEALDKSGSSSRQRGSLFGYKGNVP